MQSLFFNDLESDVTLKLALIRFILERRWLGFWKWLGNARSVGWTKNV